MLLPALVPQPRPLSVLEGHPPDGPELSPHWQPEDASCMGPESGAAACRCCRGRGRADGPGPQASPRAEQLRGPRCKRPGAVDGDALLRRKRSQLCLFSHLREVFTDLRTSCPKQARWPALTFHAKVQSQIPDQSRQGELEGQDNPGLLPGLTSVTEGHPRLEPATGLLHGTQTSHSDYCVKTRAGSFWSTWQLPLPHQHQQCHHPPRGSGQKPGTRPAPLHHSPQVQSNAGLVGSPPSVT